METAGNKRDWKKQKVREAKGEFSALSDQLFNKHSQLLNRNLRLAYRSSMEITDRRSPSELPTKILKKAKNRNGDWTFHLGSIM